MICLQRFNHQCKLIVCFYVSFFDHCIFRFRVNQRSHSPIVISSCSSDPEDMAQPTEEVAIDLTADSDKEDMVVVDLTSPLANRPQRKKRKRAAKEGKDRTVSGPDDSDVIILSPAPPSRNLRPSPPPLRPVDPPPSSLPPVFHPVVPPLPSESPSSQGISCPICMDSKRQFTESGRTLVSTKCGHVFCDACIKQSIKMNHKCPTCSTRLTLKQYHRIYL